MYSDYSAINRYIQYGNTWIYLIRKKSLMRFNISFKWSPFKKYSIIINLTTISYNYYCKYNHIYKGDEYRHHCYMVI